MQVDWSYAAYPKTRTRLKGAAYQKLKAEVFERDGAMCRLQDCRLPYRVNLGHIKGKGRGGSDTPDNTVPMCDFCNDAMETGHLRITWDGITPVKIERRINPEHSWKTTYQKEK
jgi:hypothetical protein